MSRMIQFQHCDIALSDQYSLRSIDWVIESGETWVIVGPNGSGKSALVASLVGEGSPTSGSRVINETNIAVVSMEQQGELILRERERDDSDLTDEINEGTLVQQMLDEVCSDSGLQHQLIDALGMQGLLGRGFRKLSTGETRKVLIIRALSSSPKLLVLDEPFEGLDVRTVAKVRDLLKQLSLGTTLILALNRLDEIPEFTTHAIRMESGRIAQKFDCCNGEEARRLLSQISQIRSSDINFHHLKQKLIRLEMTMGRSCDLDRLVSVT